jgi:hypothetical protein
MAIMQVIGEYRPENRTVSCVDDKDKPLYAELLSMFGSVSILPTSS